jgi:Xaa-Pro aminopeptidase
MQANMVFTVEPGIYIPAEGLESVLKMTWYKQTGALQLMRNIPIEEEN